MNKKILIFILLVISLFSLSFFAQRGLKAVRTPEGKEIVLYKGSYALIVGNSKYTSGWDPLTAAEKDAEELGGILRKNGFEVTIMKNTTKSRFLAALGNFTYKYGQNGDNQLLFFYAGHGHTTTLASGEELGYLVMVDAPPPEKDSFGFDNKSVDMQTIITYAKKIKSKHVLFIFDSCFSGTVLNLRERVVPKAISDAVRYPVRQFITAGRADEPVPDRSVFKQLFIDMLEGKVEEPIKDGYITGEELGLFLKSRVPEYNKFQHPQYGKIRDPNLDKGDFVFVMDKVKISEAEEAQLPPKPPKTTGVDLTSIEKAGEERTKIKKQWQSWQTKMQSDFSKVEKLDKRPAYRNQEKKTAWRKFLDNYKTNNLYSNEDEQLRQRAAQRIKELAKPEVSVGARVSLRSFAKSMDLKEAKAMFKSRGFFCKLKNRFGDFSNSYESRVINEDKVVLDHATGLMWHQSGSDNLMTYDKAKQWIADLNNRGYAGYRDWRLPTLEEGASLLERTKMNGDLYIDPIFSAKQRWIWTSDIDASRSGSVWIVQFHVGIVIRFNVINPHYVRPVRSGR